MIRRIQIAMLFVMCFFYKHIYAQPNTDSLIAFYSKKMNTYLVKESKVAESFVLNNDGIQVFAPITDTTDRQYEFTLYWSDVVTFLELNKTMNSRAIYEYYMNREKNSIKEWTNTNERIVPPSVKKNSLDSLRIAIDPGHIAGDLETAKMERKFVEMKRGTNGKINDTNVEIIEGKLTLATAIMLRKKLEKKGAIVMLTRDKPNVSAFGIDYKKWKDSLFLTSLESAYKSGEITFEERHFLKTKASDTEIFRMFFLQEDMRERARKINAFKPDLTLIIHYNVDETNSNWSKPSKKNYNMAFVGGCFGENELDNPEERIDFLRLLLSNDIETSSEFSYHVLKNLVRTTKVPAALNTDALYLQENCLNTDYQGIYSRNLVLTRRVKGTICYGESLYQDNINECKELCKENISIEGIITSKRVEEIAKSYYDGIVDYLRNRNK